MRSTDREEFKVQLERMCAGFNVPCSPAREAAFWTGLSAMTIAQMSRAIDLSLGEAGPDRIPTPKQLRALYHKSRNPQPTQAAARAGFDLPSVQAQLTEYAAIRLGVTSFQGTWNHIYDREGQCVGIVIERDGQRLGYSAEAMIADVEIHGRVMNKFKHRGRDRTADLPFTQGTSST